MNSEEPVRWKASQMHTVEKDVNQQRRTSVELIFVSKHLVKGGSHGAWILTYTWRQNCERKYKLVTTFWCIKTGRTQIFWLKFSWLSCKTNLVHLYISFYVLSLVTNHHRTILPHISQITDTQYLTVCSLIWQFKKREDLSIFNLFNVSKTQKENSISNRRKLTTAMKVF